MGTLRAAVIPTNTRADTAAANFVSDQPLDTSDTLISQLVRTRLDFQ